MRYDCNGCNENYVDFREGIDHSKPHFCRECEGKAPSVVTVTKPDPNADNPFCSGATLPLPGYNAKITLPPLPDKGPFQVGDNVRVKQTVPTSFACGVFEGKLGVVTAIEHPRRGPGEPWAVVMLHDVDTIDRGKDFRFDFDELEHAPSPREALEQAAEREPDEPLTLAERFPVGATVRVTKPRDIHSGKLAKVLRIGAGGVIVEGIFDNRDAWFYPENLTVEKDAQAPSVPVEGPMASPDSTALEDARLSASGRSISQTVLARLHTDFCTGLAKSASKLPTKEHSGPKAEQLQSLGSLDCSYLLPIVHHLPVVTDFVTRANVSSTKKR